MTAAAVGSRVAAERVDVDVAELVGDRAGYKLLYGSVVPRPIAWVSTVSPSGVPNLAPFSAFTVASRTPPMLCFSIEGTGDGEARAVKDTEANIRASGEFVIGIPSAELMDAVALTSSDLPDSVDEFDYAGLAAGPAAKVSAPRILDAPINIECVLEQLIPLGDSQLVIGRAVMWSIRADLYADGRIDARAMGPLGRMAGPVFATDFQVVTRQAADVAAMRGGRAGRATTT